MAKINGLDVPLFCEKFERRGRSNALVRFADIDTNRRVGEFLGVELRMDLIEEDGDDEFFMEDLIGFTVEANGEVGELVDYYHSETNPLFGIALQGEFAAKGEILIPAAEEFIAHIDFDDRRIKFLLPDGIFEL